MKHFFILVFLGVTLLFSEVVYSQTANRVISGKVVSSADKQPLPGAAISVPSKSKAKQTQEKDVILSVSLGTVADFEGHFSLKIPDEQDRARGLRFPQFGSGYQSGRIKIVLKLFLLV